MGSYSWNTAGGGVWNDPTKWTGTLPNTVPGDGDTATIAQTISADATITTPALTSFPDTLTVTTTASAGRWLLQPNTVGITLDHNLTVNVPTNGGGAIYDFNLRPVLLKDPAVATVYLLKTGAGGLALSGPNSTIDYVDVEDGTLAGALTFYPATNEWSDKCIRMGTAGVTPTAGLTYDGNFSGAGIITTTPIRFCRDVTIANALAAAALTFNGFLDFRSVSGSPIVLNFTTGAYVNGALHGTSGFTKVGSTTRSMVLSDNSGVSTLTGPVTVTAGTLDIGASNALQCATLNYTGATGTFSYTAGATIGGLSGERNIALGAAINFGPATTPAGVTLVNATYTGSFSGAGKISKYGAHTQAFVGGVNTHTGGIDIYGGRVRGSDSTSALGSSSGAITVYTGGALEVTGIYTVNKTSAALTLGAGAGNVALYGSGGGGLSPANIVLATDTVISANQFTITSAGDVSDAGAGRKLTFTGAGYLVWDVPISSSYSGGTVLDSSDLRVSRSIASAGLSSIFGTGTIELYKNLTYVGGGVAGTFFRAITCPAGGSPEFKTLGPGELTISGNLTVNAATLLFAGGGGANIRVTGGLTMSSGALNFAGGETTYFSSNVSGTVAINFISGALLLGGTLTNTGGINMTAANVLGAVTPGGTVTYLPTTGNLNISAGSLIDKFRARIVTAAGVGGTITALLEDQTVGGGETTLTVGSGHTLTVQPNTAYTGATGNNTYSGATSISGTCNAVLSSGSINPAIGNGKVFGNSPVTVENGGHIRTKASFATGQMRYKSLKFKAGSKLSIGAIA